MGDGDATSYLAALVGMTPAGSRAINAYASIDAMRQRKIAQQRYDEYLALAQEKATQAEAQRAAYQAELGQVWNEPGPWQEYFAGSRQAPPFKTKALDVFNTQRKEWGQFLATQAAANALLPVPQPPYVARPDQVFDPGRVVAATTPRTQVPASEMGPPRERVIGIPYQVAASEMGPGDIGMGPAPPVAPSTLVPRRAPEPAGLSEEEAPPPPLTMPMGAGTGPMFGMIPEEPVPSESPDLAAVTGLPNRPRMMAPEAPLLDTRRTVTEPPPAPPELGGTPIALTLPTEAPPAEPKPGPSPLPTHEQAIARVPEGLRGYAVGPLVSLFGATKPPRQTVDPWAKQTAEAVAQAMQDAGGDKVAAANLLTERGFPVQASQVLATLPADPDTLMSMGETIESSFAALSEAAQRDPAIRADYGNALRSIQAAMGNPHNKDLAKAANAAVVGWSKTLAEYQRRALQQKHFDTILAGQEESRKRLDILINNATIAQRQLWNTEAAARVRAAQERLTSQVTRLQQATSVLHSLMNTTTDTKAIDEQLGKIKILEEAVNKAANELDVTIRGVQGAQMGAATPPPPAPPGVPPQSRAPAAPPQAERRSSITGARPAGR